MSFQSKQSVITKNRSEPLTIRLHQKNFLQPFEQFLAEAELKGLDLEIISTDKKSNIFSIKPNSKKLQSKLSRLSYFDWIMMENFRPTIQACREGAKSSVDSPDHPSFPKRRMLRFGPHNLHEYRGKFFPQLVRSFCNISGLRQGDKVLDPFCGSGTTIAEARALDLRAFGLDRNPLSILITDVKAHTLSWSMRDIDNVNKSIDVALGKKIVNNKFTWNENDQIYLHRWFANSTLKEISALLKKIDTIQNEYTRKFTFVCLSDIIRTISFQKNDDLRVRKEIRPSKSGECNELFRNKVKSSLKSIRYLNSIDPEHNMEYHVEVGDAKFLDKYFKHSLGKFDAVITSPPYATALPYLDTDRLSLIVLGLLPHKKHPKTEIDMIGSREINEKQRKEMWEYYLRNKQQLPSSISNQINKIAESFHSDTVGFRRRNLPSLLAKYFFDMKTVFEKMKELLKSGSPLFLVIGNNSTRISTKRINIPTDEFLVDLANQAGFQTSSEINMELLSSYDIFKNNRNTKEKTICLVNT